MAVQADNKFLAAGALISEDAFFWPFLVKVSNGWLIKFIMGIRQGYLFCGLTLFHSERPKLYRVLAVLNAIGLNTVHGNVDPNKHPHSNSVPHFLAKIIYTDLHKLGSSILKL